MTGALRARTPVDTRFDLRRHDDAGRHWSYAPVPHSGVSARLGDCNGGRPRGTRSHHMGAAPVHGYASVFRRSASGLGGALVFLTGILIGKS